MTMRITTMAEHEWSDQLLDELFADGFEPWMTSDHEVKQYIGTVRAAFGDMELVVADGEVPVAAGWCVPISWSGDVTDLPDGYTDALRHAVELHGAEGSAADACSIMAIQVHPAHRGRGVAARLITAMRELARERGLDRVIAPVRPTRKSSYPTVPIDRYMRWEREDGLPLDPWLRTHVRAGASIIAAAPQSQTFTASVGDWASWCRMAFPESGSFVVPGGLELLDIDLDRDLGTYVEPNIWVEYGPLPER